MQRGVVICTNTGFPYLNASRFASVPALGEKSFHGNDYSFYYVNIRENAATRAAACLAAH